MVSLLEYLGIPYNFFFEEPIRKSLLKRFGVRSWLDDPLDNDKDTSFKIWRLGVLRV